MRLIAHPGAKVIDRSASARPWARRAAASVLVLALASASGASAREPDTSEGGASSASALIDRGIELRRSGDDLGALELFRQAEQLEPESTRVKVHLAANYQALGQWEEADRYLTQALADPSDPYVSRHQATLAGAKETIDRHIGLLQVSGGPAGTELRLNGRQLGTLPLDRTLRVAAGIYTLEAQHAGYYPVTRSVALAGGTLVRESLVLAPLSATPKSAAPGRDRASEAASQGAAWLPWVFGGLALGAGGVTAGAWVIRERHAARWNDDDECLGPTRTREQLCGDEIRNGERAQTWMWVAGAGTAAFATAAVLTLWVQSGGREAAGSEAAGQALGCGLGVGQVLCAGRF